MSWLRKLFKNQELENQNNQLKSRIGDMERNYDRLINSSIFQQTFQQMGQDSPVYDLQNPEYVLEQTILSNPDVLAVVSKIYGMAQNAKLKCYQKNEEGEFVTYEGPNKDHYNRFLRKPSDQMDFQEFLFFYFQDILVFGNSFWNSVKYEKGAKKGMVSQLVAMYAQYVTVITSNDPVYPVKGYEYYFNPNSAYQLAYDDVTHIKWANPKYVYGGQFYGLSPMKVALKVVQKQNNIINQEKNQVAKGGPSTLLFKDNEGPQGFNSTPQQIEETKQSFKNYENDGRSDPILFPTKVGKIDLNKTAKEMGLTESSQYGLRKICNVLSFPSVLVNDNSNSTFNNVAEARKSAWTDCVMRHLETFAPKFTESIIDPIEIEQGVCFKWDYSGISELSADLNKIVDAMTKAKATPNELRKAVGLDPIDQREMNDPYFTMNEIPLSAIGDDGLNEPES